MLEFYRSIWSQFQNASIPWSWTWYQLILSISTQRTLVHFSPFAYPPNACRLFFLDLRNASKIEWALNDDLDTDLLFPGHVHMPLPAGSRDMQKFWTCFGNLSHSSSAYAIAACKGWRQAYPFNSWSTAQLA